MKTSQDPRHKKREKIIKKLYEWSFSNGSKTPPLIKNILKGQKTIDKVISESAPEWPVEKLNKVDLAILRLAVWELLIERKKPVKVVIDEAIELGKEYGAESSSKFINGVLGTVVKKHLKKKLLKKQDKDK
jgi:transcription termination factor NusB